MDNENDGAFVWLDGYSLGQLLARAGEAEARIEEETAVMMECHRRLKKLEEVTL